jgi:uncharacterized protein (TIGR03435 family)
MPLRDLILYAYGVKPTQLKGPEWLADDGRPYDIEATMPASASPAEVGIVTASKWRMLGGVCPSPCAKVVLAESISVILHARSRRYRTFLLRLGSCILGLFV